MLCSPCFGPPHHLWQFIIDAQQWRRTLPKAIGAFFYISGAGNKRAMRNLLDRFQGLYGLTDATHPLVRLKLDDWETPFQLEH
jgi:hypothetical protein